MNYYIGIDLGTSSCKAILTNKEGEIIGQASRDYDVIYPADGWTEQNPDDYITAAREIFDELCTEEIRENVRGISFGGQQHSLVILDENDKVIRPTILWHDSRTKAETDFMNNDFGIDNMHKYTGNIAFAGFTASKLLWLKKNEPENFKKIRKIMLPKDYLAYKLTGVHCGDYSDSAGTLLLDVKNKCWSKEMMELCDVEEFQLPKLFNSYEVVGKVLPEWNFPNAVVCAGSGDNAAAAVGTGTIHNGDCNISLGTSGTLFVAQDRFAYDENNGLHEFCHATGHWHLMGVLLIAAQARKWWLEEILNTKDYDGDEQEIVNAKDSNVIFLPYLLGERSPHNDPTARGAFIGLTTSTTKGEMSRAIMEGIAFALKDSLEIVRKNGVYPDHTCLCGGGARSKIWRQIVADVLNIDVNIPMTEQGPSYGGAIMAMVGAGEYKDLDEACAHIIRIKDTVHPDPERVAYYEKKYERFHKLYPALKGLFM